MKSVQPLESSICEKEMMLMSDNNNVIEDITLENIHPKYIGRLSEKEMDEIVDKSLRCFLKDDLIIRIDLMRSILGLVKSHLPEWANCVPYAQISQTKTFSNISLIKNI